MHNKTFEAIDIVKMKSNECIKRETRGQVNKKRKKCSEMKRY